MFSNTGAKVHPGVSNVDELDKSPQETEKYTFVDFLNFLKEYKAKYYKNDNQWIFLKSDKLTNEIRGDGCEMIVLREPKFYGNTTIVGKFILKNGVSGSYLKIEIVETSSDQNLSDFIGVSNMSFSIEKDENGKFISIDFEEFIELLEKKIGNNYKVYIKDIRCIKEKSLLSNHVKNEDIINVNGIKLIPKKGGNLKKSRRRKNKNRRSSRRNKK